MGALTTTEQSAVERAAAEPMLAQVEGVGGDQSGSRNLAGLADMAYLLADAFAALAGERRAGRAGAGRRGRRGRANGRRSTMAATCI